MLVLAFIIVLTVLMIAQSSIAIKDAKAAGHTDDSNYKFSVAMLVIAIVFLIGSAAYLGYLVNAGPAAAL